MENLIYEQKMNTHTHTQNQQQQKKEDKKCDLSEKDSMKAWVLFELEKPQ